METLTTQLQAKYLSTRKHSEEICKPLQNEDFVAQPVEHVSPPKWHLGHTSWFFESFILERDPDYKCFDESYKYLLNSYYEGMGKRVSRNLRGAMTRPSVKDILKYRAHIDQQMTEKFNRSSFSEEEEKLIVLGINHEQQHQELMYTDLKFILGMQPGRPRYEGELAPLQHVDDKNFTTIEEGIYEIGFKGNGDFAYDNEFGVHRQWIDTFQIRKSLVSNEEYLKFIEDGAYQNHQYWHSEAWAWINENNIDAPLYWENVNGQWMYYDLKGLEPIDPQQAVQHLSWYEAAAYAEWAGCRLPTEFEWEVAQEEFQWGHLWEWTGSAYLPYPGYKKAAGAVGEYNGKFMINQMVLRGASRATPQGHSRSTYRNFWHPHYQFQFTGLRLVKNN